MFIENNVTDVFCKNNIDDSKPIWNYFLGRDSHYVVIIIAYCHGY